MTYRETKIVLKQGIIVIYTCADLRISPKGPYLRSCEASSSPRMLSSSSIKLCGCQIRFPLSTYLQSKTQLTLCPKKYSKENRKAKQRHDFFHLPNIYNYTYYEF